ncbi:transglutaminase domain-containing protein [Streptococcus halichoeri]|nr:transglutaminase domain-containing protein [Streptococcus halichoeri]
MGKRKTTTISLLTLSIIGMTAFTSGHLPKSSSFSPTYALEQPAGPVAKSFEKIDGGKEKFVEELKKELKDASDIKIWELGQTNFKFQNININDLASKIPDGYTAVKVNGQLHHQKVVFIVKNEDILVNNQSEYEEQTKGLSQKVGTFGVHSLFDLKKDNYLDIILESNGLRKTLGTYNGINGLTLYSNTLGLANPYTEKYENSEITLEKIKDNDEKLLEMLKESGAAHAPTEREKVKRWVVYLKKKIPYDFDALDVYLTNRQAYNLSSDLFAVATRKKAMCVGYSIATARAMNLLGLPSYMVEGVTKNGALHATTRVFFDNAWHLVDSTGGGADENQSEYYYDFYFNNSLDQYKNVTQAEENRNDRNYMVINKEFEEWAKGQSTAKLLYVNAEAALRERVPFIVSQEIREKFKTVNEKLRNDFETFKAAVQSNDSLKERIAGLISSIDEDQKRVEPDRVITEEDYKILNSALATNIIFYNELQRDLKVSLSSQYTDYENSKKEIETKFEVDKKEFKDKHKEKLAKYEEFEERARLDETKFLAQRSQRPSTVLTFEEKERLRQQIQEETQKLDSKMSDAAKQSSSPTEQARISSATSSTSSRSPQVRTNEEQTFAKKRAKRALASQEPTVSPTPATPARPAPASPSAVATPRSTHPAQPQSRARVGMEPRSPRNRRSLETPGTESTPAPARPAPAPVSQTTPAPARPAPASVQAPNSQYRYHSPYSPRFNHNYSNNYNYNYNYNYNHYQSSRSQSLNYK